MSGERKGLVLVADGIGGFGVCGRSMRWTIPRSGLPLEVEVLPWGHGLGRWHADLTDRARHKEMASRLAARVVEFRRESPGAPVYLVGKSGGTGIVVWALEQLPEEAVDASVLLAPAISPGYDLGRALRALKGGMTVFYSPLDLFLLSAGTRVFGTIDRVRGDSAGLVGFRPPAGSQGLYEEKLRQVKWTPAMVRDLSLGGHFAVDWPPFLRKHVLPLLAGEGVSGGRPSA